jgi:hypothetical protein
MSIGACIFAAVIPMTTLVKIKKLLHVKFTNAVNKTTVAIEK